MKLFFSHAVKHISEFIIIFAVYLRRDVIMNRLSNGERQKESLGYEK